MDIKIDKKTYEEFIKSQEELEALRRGGVDNWDGYDESMKELWKLRERKEKIEDYFEDILQTLGESAYEPSEIGAGFAFSEEAEFKAWETFNKAIAELSKKD